MNHEEKILELLTEIQKKVSNIESDVTDLKQDVSDLKQDVSGLKQDVAVLQDDVAALKQESQFIKTIVIKMENEHGKKLDALFDGYSSNFEFIRRFGPRITALELKMDKLAFEVEYLKAAK